MCALLSGASGGHGLCGVGAAFPRHGLRQSAAAAVRGLDRACDERYTRSVLSAAAQEKTLFLFFPRSAVQI